MMKTLKRGLLSVLFLAAVGLAVPNTSVAASADTRDFFCEYSAREKDNEYMTFGSSDIKTYTAEEAEAAGIPDGYENEVFEIIQQSGGTNAGVFLDFTFLKIDQIIKCVWCYFRLRSGKWLKRIHSAHSTAR